MTIVNKDERQYSIGKLNVFQQFHVTRRLAPLAASLLSAFQSAATTKPSLTEQTNDPATEQMHNLDVGFMALADTLSSMKQDDLDFILQTCLGVVSVIEKGGALVPLFDKNIGQLRYADLNMPTMINLTMQVIQENLGSYFLSGQQQPTEPTVTAE